MTKDYSDEQEHFRLAYELAYFIHADKDVAFFVAEDALDSLASALGRQEKNRKRKPPELLRGFLKWGERSRPVRQAVKLDERQMLQWLVYKHSEPWERETEQAGGHYLPTEEDMIVRYVERLVYLTVRYGSFYAVLAVGSLLHQFNRRETRMFYDTLTQNDAARMKDSNYIGKQRLELLEKVARRFGQLIQTVKIPGDETQFLLRAQDAWANDLVRESLRRFVPWGTACVIGPKLDVMEVDGLYFSEASDGGEEAVELNRIHTVLDPDCFARFAEGLSRYVRTLPDADRDKSCNYDSLDERLRVPRFSLPGGGPPRGDRFGAPQLTRNDYIRLERMLAARARRRKNFAPRQICVYVDDVLSYSFDPRITSRAGRLIQADAGLIEVRGRDDAGEMTLALVLGGIGGGGGGARSETFVHPSNKKVTVRLTPPADGDGSQLARLEVVYTAPRLTPGVGRRLRQLRSGLTGGGGTGGRGFLRGRGRAITVGAAALIVAVASALVWWQSRPSPVTLEVKLPEQVGRPRGEEQRVVEPGATAPTPLPSPPPRRSPTPKEVVPAIARASWSARPEMALLAIPVESMRREAPLIKPPPGESRYVLSLPLYDDEGRAFSHYRLTLSAAEARLWRQTLRAPQASLTGYAHLLEFTVSTARPPAAGHYELKVEGRADGSWRPVGRVALGPRTP